MKKILMIIALFACTHAQADEASKRAKIGKLIVVQGLEQMIQQQLDHSAASVSGMGEKMFASLAGDAVKVQPATMKKMRAAHDKFLRDAAKMFTAKELVDSWSANYGKDLSESDIDKILAYYSSPIGQKDVAASKVAMNAFSQTFAAESEKRVMRLLQQYNKDLEAAAKP